MVSLEEALVAPGTTEVGEKEQLAPLGNPEQLSETAANDLQPGSWDSELVQLLKFGERRTGV